MSSTIQMSVADLEQGIHVSDMSFEASINLSDARERVCRICHMGLESDGQVYGVPIELGCSCKDDLAAAHKLYDDTWFRNKGRRTCEICHSVARNVFAINEETTENLRDSYNNNAVTVSTAQPQTHPTTFLPESSPEKFSIYHPFNHTYHRICVGKGISIG